MPRSLAALRPYLYLLALVWINVYICREAFYTESTGHFNSIHGEWMALARLGDFRWWHASWWRWWGAGSPLEYTYAPLVPMLTGFMAAMPHGSIPLGFHQVSGAVYCTAPLMLYAASWKISGSAGYSFIAAAMCSLLSAVAWVVPDSEFHWHALRDARLLQLVFEWDDLAHLLSILFLPAVLWFLWQALHSRKALHFAVAGILMALMMIANAFGMVAIAFTIVTLPLAMDGPFSARLKNFVLAGATAVCAWAVISPWLPPSLLMKIHSNSILDTEAAPAAVAVRALAIVAVIEAAVWYIARRRIAHWGFRWLLMYGSLVLLIPALDYYAHLRFLPQPGRYRIEANFALCWMAVFALKPLFDRAPRRLPVVLAILLLYPASLQIVHYRRYARVLLGHSDPSQSVEYSAATWLATHLAGQRVMLPGSVGFFADAFADVPQADAQPYTTAPNASEYLAYYIVRSGDGAGDQDAAISILWLKAFGASSVVVPGPQSPEYWHPFAHPGKFDGVLPVLWRERDTTAYQVSGGKYSLAHVLPPSGLVHHPPVNGIDVTEIRRYVAAIDDPSAPSATLTWNGNDAAVIDAQMRPGDIVSAQITWDPGWHARVNGVPRKVFRDGIGLMAVDAGCTGDCRIDLEYDGGTERRVCRIAGMSLPAILLIVFFGRRMGGLSLGRRPRSVGAPD